MQAGFRMMTVDVRQLDLWMVQRRDKFQRQPTVIGLNTEADYTCACTMKIKRRYGCGVWSMILVFAPTDRRQCVRTTEEWSPRRRIQCTISERISIDHMYRLSRDHVDANELHVEYTPTAVIVDHALPKMCRDQSSTSFEQHITLEILDSAPIKVDSWNKSITRSSAQSNSYRLSQGASSYGLTDWIDLHRRYSHGTGTQGPVGVYTMHFYSEWTQRLMES